MDIKIYNNDKIREKLYYNKMESGLKVYYIPKEGYTKQYAIFATDYGSIDNMFTPINGSGVVEVPEGIAHFLEHKLFEEPDQNIFDKFSKLGANVNAYTNFNQTAYLFSSTENFYESLETLINFVQHPHFTDENVEKEKGIIAQEINMYKDSASWRVFFNCLSAMYIDHPVKIDIAGTVESIQDINKELLYQCYNTFYNPTNMVLFIVGDLNFEEVLKIVDSSERKDYKEVEEINRVYPIESKEIREKFIEEKMLTSSPMFYMGFKDYDCGLVGDEQVKKDIVTNMILDMLLGSSSVFYNKLYEEGLIDNSFGSYFSGAKTYGHSLIVGESTDPKKVYDRILFLMDSPVEDILLKDDFDRIKKKEIGNFLMGLNSVEAIANGFIDLYFDGFLLINYLTVLESIKYEEIKRRFKDHFTRDNVVLSIINPLE